MQDQRQSYFMVLKRYITYGFGDVVLVVQGEILLPCHDESLLQRECAANACWSVMVRGVAPDVLMKPGQMVPLSALCLSLCCAAMPALKQHSSSNSSKARIRQWCSSPTSNQPISMLPKLSSVARSPPFTPLLVRHPITGQAAFLHS
eukprot:1148340-Pelagomonas_calceolata.AAC.1